MDIIERLRAGIQTSSAGDTQTIAAGLAPRLPPNSTLALHGDLGAGKTTFVQGLARGFRIDEPVSSPTFTICRIYPPAGPAGIQLVHIDAYRLSGPAEMDALLLDDFLRTPWCIALEWPENVAGWLPADAWRVELTISPDERRSIRLR